MNDDWKNPDNATPPKRAIFHAHQVINEIRQRGIEPVEVYVFSDYVEVTVYGSPYVLEFECHADDDDGEGPILANVWDRTQEPLDTKNPSQWWIKDIYPADLKSTVDEMLAWYQSKTAKSALVAR